MVSGFWLLILFAVSILILLIAIIVLKINPFLALLGTSLLTAFLVGMPIGTIASALSSGFGGTLTSVGIVIGLGIVFGNILSEAGATNSIAKGLLRMTGSKRAALAVTIAGFLISIPVFMDAAFVIMMPIVKYIARETKRPLMIFVCALGVGTIVGHGLVIPTPGPLAVAANMEAEIAPFLLYSLVAGAAAILLGGWLYGKVFRRREPYAEQKPEMLEEKGLQPSFALSLLNLLFPILLILVCNILLTILPEGTLFAEIIALTGDKNVALLLGVAAAFLSLRGYLTKRANDVVAEAADSAGLILLITGAGGAFGSIINTSGIGEFLVDTMANLGIPAILLGFALSALLRVSQGSTTVAIVTASAILGPAVAASGTDSAVLVGLAICAGGIGFSLPNDSGFWILSRLSGISVADTLKSWTAGGTIASFSAFGVVLLLDCLRQWLPLPLL